VQWVTTKSGAAPATVSLTMLLYNHWKTGKPENREGKQLRMKASQETGPKHGICGFHTGWSRREAGRVWLCRNPTIDIGKQHAFFSLHCPDHDMHGGCTGEQVNGFTKKHMLTGIATMLLALPAQATELLPTMVVTAGRIAQGQASVSSDVTVITQKEIVQSQATSVASLLRAQAGINVASSGGPGKATSVFMRGASSGQTLVLIDGVRVGSATVGSFNWGNLSTAGIERIEIVRGPQSSLYGADAMGGVIQIFTRKGKGAAKVRIHAEGGSYGTSSGHMSVSGMAKSGVSYAMTIDGLHTAGISAAANGTEKDPYRQLTVSGRVSVPVGAGELELIGREVDGKTGLDGYASTPPYAFGDILNYTSNTRQTVTSAKLTYPINDMVESSLQLSRSTNQVISRDPGVLFNNSDFSTHIDQLTWQNHVDLHSVSLVAGLNMYRSKGYSGSAGLDRSVSHTAGFTALAWHNTWVDLNGSARLNSNSVTANTTTYKAGLALHPIRGLKITANYGTGFKLPSINDLYYPASAFSAGNPNLKPETSRGWDAGIAYQFSKDKLKAGLGLTWFNQSYINLISWQTRAGSFVYSPINIGRAHTKGLEISANMTYGPAYINANWTYLSARNLITGALLARRAKESGNVTIGATYAKINAELVWHLVGPRYSSAGDSQYMQGYQKVDIRASYAINKQWKLTARVNNATNKKYAEVYGYGVFGRAWYGGVSTVF